MSHIGWTQEKQDEYYYELVKEAKMLRDVKNRAIILYKAIRDLKCCVEGSFGRTIKAMEDFEKLIGNGIPEHEIR